MQKSIKIILILTILTLSACSPDSNNIDKSSVFSESETETTKIETEENLIVWEKNKFEKVKKIDLPNGYERVELEKGSFKEYLRNLPLKTDTNQVMLYNGEPKGNQRAQFAVIDIPVGDKDLEQCADWIIKVRANYLFENELYDQISFNFTNGFKADYSKYREGYRIAVNGNEVNWVKKAKKDYSKETFNQYLENVYMYAGTLSLSKQLAPKALKDLEIGDVFIDGGTPGHAQIVVDLAIHQQTGDKIFLMAQSYMPAQEMHVIINPNSPNLNPWYQMPNENEFVTAERVFSPVVLMGF
jgi:hypothetical protein